MLQMSKVWLAGLLVGCWGMRPLRADTNATYSVSFENYTVRGTTYSVAPITGIHTGDALPKLDPSMRQVWLQGWADAADVKYYDANGEPLVPFTGDADVTLHALFDPQYLPLGVYVNGQELDAMSAAGRQGEGWSYDAEASLVTLSAPGEYVLSGSHLNGKVHFQVVTNLTLVLSNLVLQTTSDAHPGVIDVIPGVAADIRLAGTNTINAAAMDLAGIFCPQGASVKLWSERKRDVYMAAPTNMLYHGVLTEREYANHDLTVSGGGDAAGIGGRKRTDDGISGTITIQNCSIWVTGGSGACAVGAGSQALSTAGTNACGTVRFLGYPSVRQVVYVSDSYPRVRPSPHGDWETPLFPRMVPSRGGPGETSYNVFWFPYGTTRVRSTAYSDSDGTVSTNEVSFTVTHELR